MPRLIFPDALRLTSWQIGDVLIVQHGPDPTNLHAASVEALSDDGKPNQLGAYGQPLPLEAILDYARRHAIRLHNALRKLQRATPPENRTSGTKCLLCGETSAIADFTMITHKPDCWHSLRRRSQAA